MEKIKNIRDLLDSSGRKGFWIRGIKEVENKGEKEQGEAEAERAGAAASGPLSTWQICLDGLPGYTQGRVAGSSKRSGNLYKNAGEILKSFLISVIKIYQRAISPLFPHTCRFYPTCSNYSIEAIQKHGVFKGGLMSLWRILRCNPFNPGGYDPVR